MAELKLTYFDIDGGRGEAARLAMAIGGVEYEDYRFPFAEFAEVRKHTPFRAVPVLTIDGEVIAQSNTINRFVGKLAGLYPDDPLQAARCDEIMDAVEDIVTKFVATFGMEGDELRTAREALVSGPLTLYLTSLQDKLLAHGGEYFADGRLTVADLKVYSWIRGLLAGVLDHVPTDLCERVAPRLLEHYRRVDANEAVAAHYAGR